MLGDTDISPVASLLADPARSRILLALGDGRALAASVLADEAGVAPSTASAHLSKLVAGGLLTAERHGRHRYFRLAGPEVGELLEALSRLSGARPIRSLRDGTRAKAVRYARTCYDHLAGVLGVRVIDALSTRGWISSRDGAFVAERGVLDWLASHRAELRGRRPLVRACLDWSERVPHLAGQLGAAIASVAFAERWIVRARDSRVVRVTARGRNALIRELGVEI
jgi:DNA-binding transcriptional ArsR family regulator